LRKILIRQKQGIIGRILHNGSYREQSHFICSSTLGLFSHDCCICYYSWVHLLSNTSQYEFRYDRSCSYWASINDPHSFSGLSSRKKDISIKALLFRELYPHSSNKSLHSLNLLLLVVFSLTYLVGCTSANNSSLYGTSLNNHDGSRFSLLDENAFEVTDQTYMGQVHLITFLFTNCTSLCPLVTSSIKQSLERSEDTRNTPVLIISVDPKGDTIESRNAFKNRWELSSNWRYLNGNKKELNTIWKNFYLNPQESAIESLNRQMGRKYDIIHSSPVYIVDDEGRPAVVHTNPINPDHLYEDIIRISNR